MFRYMSADSWVYDCSCRVTEHGCGSSWSHQNLRCKAKLAQRLVHLPACQQAACIECKEGSCGMGLRCEEPEDALAPHRRGPQKKKKKKKKNSLKVELLRHLLYHRCPPTQNFPGRDHPSRSQRPDAPTAPRASCLWPLPGEGKKVVAYGFAMRGARRHTRIPRKGPQKKKKNFPKGRTSRPVWAIGTGKVATPEQAEETQARPNPTEPHLQGVGYRGKGFWGL